MGRKLTKEKVLKVHKGIERKAIVRVSPDYKMGLRSDEVRERKDNGWSNVEVSPPAKTLGEIIRDNTFTYFNLIFVVLAVLICLVGSYKNLTFMPVVICNTLIGIVQEIRSKKALEKLSMMHSKHAEVMRDGERIEIDIRDLVVDDIVIFRSGNQICADAVVVDGDVRVNESLLTGESDEIKKSIGDELLSGSFVVNGRCFARLTAVGEDSYISKLTLAAKEMKSGEESEMMRSLDKLVKVVGLLLIPVGSILFIQGYFFNHFTIKESVVSMVAAVVGMIPEGLYLLASMALAVGAIRLASEKVMLHDMKSIETLARVDVLCVDKTGTITEDKMSVNDLYCVDEYLGRTEEVSQIISDFVKVMDADNSTMAAMKAYFQNPSDRRPVKIVPFSSRVKYSGVVFEEESFILGAPEILLREHYDSYQKEIEQFSEKGYRVVLFGKTQEEMGELLKYAVTPIAYVLLSNKIRENAPETFAYFAQQGVAVKVISGDNPITVSQVALNAGIKHAENYVDARTLTDETIEEAILNHTVFGRVSPEQKKQFVEILKDNGHTVAMTGDGVNDVLALKKADCSVAMASGSDAAVQASQVVLLESDFSKMPDVVLEGRRVVNNIQRSASLFLIKNIFSIILALVAVVTAAGYPFEPSQITLIGMFTIGIPGFCLAMQPNKERIQGVFLRNVTFKALPAGLTDAILVVGIVTIGHRMQLTADEIATVATLVVATVGLSTLFKICQPLDLWRGLIWAICLLGFLFCIFVMPKFFAIATLSKMGFKVLGIFIFLSFPVLWVVDQIILRLSTMRVVVYERSK